MTPFALPPHTRPFRQPMTPRWRRRQPGAATAWRYKPAAPALPLASSLRVPTQSARKTRYTRCPPKANVVPNTPSHRRRTRSIQYARSGGYEQPGIAAAPKLAIVQRCARAARVGAGPWPSGAGLRAHGTGGAGLLAASATGYANPSPGGCEALFLHLPRSLVLVCWCF
ncbi:hypothetical protein C7974DRAFT_375516 [Boeremia exigua]|uniref:uncharacterized protein n=1 Tax=Boeremia exigua TaxID=749465 RepID=UPI001E8E3D79|nr:uncharacterized protein C7974DRAFT_375516 [Boeremia exigua]KAH6633434.1 hypothetical protein C7974DRAFT_375516 [Boeremia exigua]